MSPQKPGPAPPSLPDPRRQDWQVPRGHAHIMQVHIIGASLDTDLFCRTLAHEAPDAIVYADVGGMIRFWNRGAERIFGYTASEALGKSLDIIIPAELRVRHWEAYGKMMRSGETRYGAGEVLAVTASRKDGMPVPIEFTLLLFHERDGRVLGVAAILRDATKHFEQTDTLRKELAALRSGEEGNAASRR